MQVAGGLEDIDGTQFDRSWAVNVHAQFAACRAAMVPMRRFGRLEEFAEAVLFLVSDRSSYITGHALVVDSNECLASGANSTV